MRDFNYNYVNTGNWIIIKSKIKLELLNKVIYFLKEKIANGG